MPDATVVDATVVDAAVVDADDPDAPATPRPVAPASLGFVASRRPELRWILRPRSDAAEVELCADRPCTRVIETLRGATSGRPSSDLPVGPVFWRLRGSRSGAVGRATSATWMFVVGHRSAPAGTGWGGVFDVNGDGLGDLAVGRPRGEGGAVLTFLGSPSGLTPHRVLTGDVTLGRFGRAIANAGDLNGDGYADLAVGSTAPSVRPTENAGEIRIYLGGPSGLAEPPVRLLRGESGAQRLGWSIAGAGDLDGDGYSDLLATSLRPGSTDVAVEARVYRGSADGLLGTAAVVIEAGTNSDTEGARVAGIGDVNDDGRPDFAVGLPNESNDVPGEVRVYLGSDGPLAAPVLLRGASGESFGGTVAGAGDVNGSTSAKVGQFLMGIDMR